MSLPKVLKSFCAIFRENSKSKLLQFFSEDLIQLLWTRYIDAECQELAQYVARLIGSESKQHEAYVLLQDVLINSSYLGFEIFDHKLIKAIKGELRHDQNDE